VATKKLKTAKKLQKDQAADERPQPPQAGLTISLFGVSPVCSRKYPVVSTIHSSASSV
jgi:hypothetical protein